jgi:hypothetical protein
MLKQARVFLAVGCCICAGVSGPVAAFVIGGSNFGMFGYPSADCRKPDKPRRPFSPASEWEIDRYNGDVQTYNDEIEGYIRCVREYVENGQNDIKRVREKMQEAIDRAKRD